MLRALALVGLAGALAGCDLIVQQAEERAAAEIGNAAAELGGVAMNLDLKLPPELMKNSQFEIGGVPMIQGGTVTGVKVDGAGTGAPTVNLSFTAPAGPEQVKAYFVEQFRAQGVAASLAADVLTGQTPENAFTMRFEPQGTGTLGTITIDPASRP